MCKFSSKSGGGTVSNFIFLGDLTLNDPNPRLQPPICSHEYISKTCTYRLPVLLNSINNISVIAAKINEAIASIDNITLIKFKNVIKSYMIDLYSYYCIIPNCYVCQI